MVYYDTDSRLQFAREQADRLADEMRRTRPLTPDEIGDTHRKRIVAEVFALLARVRHVRSRHVPAYHA
jgi:hypothetical protein